MSTSSLHSKTIRPGSLNGYSYYYSNRSTRTSRQKSATKKTKAMSRPHMRRLPGWTVKVGLTVLVVASLIGVPLMRGGGNSDATQASQSSQASAIKSKQPIKPESSAAATAAIPESNEPASKPAAATECTGNTQAKLIKVSVSKRHLWACEGEKVVRDGPVITGMLKYEETLTPPGTYQVYAKQTDTRLTGSDSAGSWNYPVSYWMPFLDNQHGTYGFHDATWRPNSDFGNIDPAGDKASHGCIELLKDDMQWLYEWAPAKTTLVVEN